jgi:serine/threonine protein kinase
MIEIKHVRIYQILCAIQGIRYLHKKNIIHRDFKLSNTIVKYDPETKEIFLKVNDFGFSKE